MAHQVSAADLNALYTGYKATYENAFASYQREFDGLAQMESSELEREAYPISATAALMERWEGDRKFKDLLTKVTYVDNEDPWEISFRIKRRDLELRRKMSIEQAAQAHGKAAAFLDDDLIVTALQGGTAAAYVDGLFFFSAAHLIVPWDASVGTWRNLRTGHALTKANVQTVMTDMRSHRGWDNRPMRLSDFTIWVPPALEWTARRIFEQSFASDAGVATAGGNTNIMMGTAKVRVCPLLIDEPDVWYMSAGSGLPPFVLQEWRPLEVVRRFDLTSESVFTRDEYQIGSSRGVEFGRLLPHTIYRCET